MKRAYAAIGSLATAIVNILYNLIAAGLQKRALNDQFDTNTIIVLIGLALVGMFIGYLIGNYQQNNSSQAQPNNNSNDSQRPWTVKHPGESAKYSVNSTNTGAVGDYNSITMTINDEENGN